MRESILEPLEEDEQHVFAQWLTARGLLFTATAQSTWTTSIKQRARLKRVGVRKGLPDMIILIRPDQSANHRACLVLVEMKRRTQGRPTAQQIEWLECLNLVPGVEASLAHGAQEAITFTIQFLAQTNEMF